MAVGASHKIMAVHVGLLTGVFSLMQLSFAPLAGRLSDRMGFGIALLLLVRTGPQVFGSIGLLALGMVFISPKRLYRNALTPGLSPKAGDGSQSFCSDSPLPSVGEGFGGGGLLDAFYTVSNLAALTSKRSGSQTGTALGSQYAASSIGQVTGPLLGGALFAWKAGAPYFLTSVLRLGVPKLTVQGENRCYSKKQQTKKPNQQRPRWQAIQWRIHPERCLRVSTRAVWLTI